MLLTDLPVLLLLLETRDDRLKLATGEKAFFAVVLMTSEILGSGVWYLKLALMTGAAVFTERALFW